MSELETVTAQMMARLRARLVADAKALASGGHASGGIRRQWRTYARMLAAEYRAASPPGPSTRDAVIIALPGRADAPSNDRPN